jgi:hypothetical protein
VEVIRLPPSSPNVNSFAERFVLSIQSECLDRIVPLGEAHLRRSVSGFVRHYRFEPNHQGLGNELIDGPPSPANTNGGSRGASDSGDCSTSTTAKRRECASIEFPHTTRSVQWRARATALENDQLLAQRQVLQGQRGAGAEGRPSGLDEGEEEPEHGQIVYPLAAMGKCSEGPKITPGWNFGEPQGRLTPPLRSDRRSPRTPTRAPRSRPFVARPAASGSPRRPLGSPASTGRRSRGPGRCALP